MNSIGDHTPPKQDFLNSVLESHYGETMERLSVLNPNAEKAAFVHQSVWQKRQPALDIL